MRKMESESESESENASENTMDITMNISDEFVDVVMVSIEILDLILMGGKLKKNNKSRKALEKELERLFQYVQESSQVPYDDVVALSTAYLYAGLSYDDSDKEELRIAESHYIKCMCLIKIDNINPKSIMTILRVLNELSTVNYKLHEFDRSRSFLLTAVETYVVYTKSKVHYTLPISLPHYLGMINSPPDEEIDPRYILDNIHLVSLRCLTNRYYLNEIQKKYLTSVSHRMLNNRLKGLKGFTHDDYVEWSLSSSTLSQYLIEEGNFTAAREHLAAASYLLQKYEREKLAKVRNVASPAEYEKLDWNYKYAYTFVTTLWARYGLKLLRLSQAGFKQDTEITDRIEAAKSALAEHSKLVHVPSNFSNLGASLEEFTSQIDDKYLSSLDGAKAVFVKVLTWLQEAHSFYTIEMDIVEHVYITVNIATAYRYLSHYECNRKKKIKMHILRREILEDAIKRLHPHKEGSTEYFNMCRGIWLEVTFANSAILEIKREILEDYGRGKKVSVADTNDFVQFVRNSVNSLLLFLNPNFKASGNDWWMNDNIMYS